MATSLSVSFLLTFPVVVTAKQTCYAVSMTDFWTSNYPTDQPANAHYSRMLAVMHKSSYEMSAVGMMATNGVKTMSQAGDPSDLETEIAGLADKTAMTPVRVGTKGRTGQDWLEFPDFMMQADSDYPTVSLITMLAPSPDWYAFGTTKLYENGAFQTKTVSMMAYDSGTEEGTAFSTDNAATSPQANITELMGAVNGPPGNDTVARTMISLTFTPMGDCCYTVSMTDMWTSAYSTNAPANAHYSGMLVVTHDPDYQMSMVGTMATPGVERISQAGKSDELEIEIGNLPDNMAMSPTKVSTKGKTGQDWLEFPDFMIAVSMGNPSVSAITMIAPSPDWYAFGTGMLYEDGGFQAKNVSLVAYDSGTEDGTAFSTDNAATNPQLNIMELSMAVGGDSLTGPRTMIDLSFTPDMQCMMKKPMTCGDVKEMYRSQMCCGMPSKKFDMDKEPPPRDSMDMSRRLKRK
jgi:hypothetical protein